MICIMKVDIGDAKVSIAQEDALCQLMKPETAWRFSKIINLPFKLPTSTGIYMKSLGLNGDMDCRVFL